MTEPARNTIVGITAIAGMIGLAWLIFIFGDAPKWAVASYPVHIKMDDATGLDEGSPIRLDGLQIGEIDSIVHRAEGGTLVMCRIESKFDVPANVKVYSESSPLGGSATLKFITMPPNADPIPKAGKPVELTGVATSFASQWSNVAEKFGSLSGKIEKLADEYIKVGQSLQSLVEERSVEEVDAGRTEPNLSTVVARADQRVAELATTLQKINTLFGDEQLHKDLKDTIAGAKQFTEKANTLADKAGKVVDQSGEAIGDVRKLSAEAEKKLERLTLQYVKVADDLSDSLAEMKALAKDLRTGKGTFQKLVNDPALYDSLQDAGEKLKDVLDEAELLLQKWKAEGLPIKL